MGILGAAFFAPKKSGLDVNASTQEYPRWMAASPDFVRIYWLTMWRQNGRKTADAYDAIREIFNLGFRGQSLNLLNWGIGRGAAQ